MIAPNTLRTTDHTYRGKAYRLAEPERSPGASIRPTTQLTGCATCGLVIPFGARYVRESDPSRGHHVLCAIRTSRLVLLEWDLWPEARELARDMARAERHTNGRG